MKHNILLNKWLMGTAIATATLASPVAAQSPSPAYNPYPDDILPSDILSEIHRVQREIHGIYEQYLAQWKALPPLTYTGNPPTLQGDGYDANRIPGGLMNYDLNISPFKDTACASCHLPYTGFSGPIPSVNLTMIAYPGSYHYRRPSGRRSDTHIRPTTRS
jgi:cytochrome c peroxidase